MFYKRAALAFLVLASCKKASVPLPQRTAVLRFENLGDKNFDWQGRALSELLSRQFSSDRFPRAGSSAPGVSSERLSALTAGATRLITGYYTEAEGRLDVTAFAEDTVSQKLVGPVHASGDLASVTAAIARELGSTRMQSPYASSSAIREYAIASDTMGAAATAHYQLAVQSDPNFAPAYLGLLQSDPANARLTLATLSLHAPAFDKDAEFLHALADAEMTARKPAEAARDYKKAIAIEPTNANLRNLLAYASMYAGDEAGAQAAAADYVRLVPQDPNAFDTRGDMEMAFGHFAEAEKDYSATPWKAARARLMAGDVAGATSIVEKQPRTAITGYRAAEWLYLTGHQHEGIAAMESFAADSQEPTLRSAAYTQAAIWAVTAHDNVRAMRLADLALKPSEPTTIIMAALARFLAQPSANADAVFQGANAGPLRMRAKGLAMVVSRSYEQAVPVWKQIYENTDVNDVLPMYLYGVSLLKSGHKDLAEPLLRLYPIPSAVVAPSFESLYLPSLRQ